MVFTAIGLVLGPEVLDLVDLDGLVGSFDVVSVLLTGTLVVVLFTDASAINSSSWQDDVIPARLLGIGLPLAIVFGWLAALVLLGDLEFWEAAVLGTMLSPTDAALGKAVVSNLRVPARVRQALNIESGLNDGIALPIFIVFLETARVAEDSLPVGDIVTELFQQVGIALVVGVAVGWLGARLIRWGRTSGGGDRLLAADRPRRARRRGVHRGHAARRVRVHRRLGRRLLLRSLLRLDRATSRSRSTPRPRATC